MKIADQHDLQLRGELLCVTSGVQLAGHGSHRRAQIGRVPSGPERPQFLPHDIDLRRGGVGLARFEADLRLQPLVERIEGDFIVRRQDYRAPFPRA